LCSKSYQGSFPRHWKTTKSFCLHQKLWLTTALGLHTQLSSQYEFEISNLPLDVNFECRFCRQIHSTFAQHNEDYCCSRFNISVQTQAEVETLFSLDGIRPSSLWYRYQQWKSQDCSVQEAQTSGKKRRRRKRIPETKQKTQSWRNSSNSSRTNNASFFFIFSFPLF
jgi:hypothetical protein